MRKSNRILVAITVMVLSFCFVTPANAVSLTAVSDTMSRLKESENSNHTIAFTTSSGVAAGQSFTIIFPAGFTMGASIDYTDVDVKDDAAELTLAAVANTTTWGAAFSGTGSRTLTITSASGTIAASSVVTVEVGTHATEGATGDKQVQNHATHGTYTIPINVNSGTDTGTLAIVIVDNDQVVVSATVDPSLTFSLSANTTAFGVLAPGVVDTADTNITLTIGTNGFGGYSISVRDAGSTTNPGLYNSSASSLIGSADGTYHHDGNLASVAEGFGLQITCSAGCTTGTDVAADWRVGSDTVGGLTLAAKNVVTYASSTTADHTLAVVHKAKASASTKAGSYTDTLTYIASASF